MSLSALVPVTALASVLLLAGCGDVASTDRDGGATRDGGSTHDARSTRPGCPSVPTDHRPTDTPCSTTRPPGINQPSTDAGSVVYCTSDSQCTATDAGTNGRCTPPMANGTPGCTYDQCTIDTQCASGAICTCGGPSGSGRFPNSCLASECRVDSDCGEGGYCSPSYDPGGCGAYGGVVGYFCHRAADQCTTDECTNDSDCPEADAGSVSFGTPFCGWDGTTSRWVCSTAGCSG